jgi:5'-nucleotidase
MSKLTIAISSRALFDLEESHQVYMEQGIKAYCKYQIEHEDEMLGAGTAFPLVKKLLALNDTATGKHRIEVILLSKNSADTGLRIFNSIQSHNLDISKAAFTSGETPYRYAKPFSADLFLSTDGQDVAEALKMGFAAATIVPSKMSNQDNNQLRIAFDGDAVLFSDDSEKIYKEQGLEAFVESETDAAKEPMPGGPFKDFLSALQSIQSSFSADESPIRTALVTARAAPTHERVIRTLRAWNIRIDEALFLGGMKKGEFLKAFDADIFFDDQLIHCDSTSEHVATGHVPHGVANEKNNEILEPTPEEHAYHQGWESYFDSSNDKEGPHRSGNEEQYIACSIKKHNAYDMDSQSKLYEKWSDGWKSAFLGSK